MKIWKIAKSIHLYRGESVHNKNGHYWTTDKEWARQFTQSGLDTEIKSILFPFENILRIDPLPEAVNAEDIDRAIRTTKRQRYKAFWVHEGMGQPESVYIL